MQGDDRYKLSSACLQLSRAATVHNNSVQVSREPEKRIVSVPNKRKLLEVTDAPIPLM